MTIVKQVAITSPKHMENFADYMQNERAIDHWSVNLTTDDPFREMERTREAYGHNEPGRAGAKCTYMYQQVISFRASDCDMNGGTMTKERCREYMQEYVRARGYDEHEVFATLHRERCEAEGVDRYSWHLAINRTNLGERCGLRLCEGRSAEAKVSRANTIRDLDRQWGLQQVRANERNDELLPQQPSRAEKEMERRGEKSEKQKMREAIRKNVRELQGQQKKNPVKALAKQLEKDGIAMRMSKTGRQFQFESGPVCVNGNRLGKGFSREGLEYALGASNENVLSFARKQGLDLAARALEQGPSQTQAPVKQQRERKRERSSEKKRTRAMAQSLELM